MRKESLIKLKDGFYIEIRDKGHRVKIHRESKMSILQAKAAYEKSKEEVIYLGEMKDGKWLR